MKEFIMQRINAVLNALNNISVSGKQNLGNLSGSIAVLEELYGALAEWKDAAPTQSEPEKQEIEK